MRPLLITCQAAVLTCVWFFLTTAAGAAPNTDDPGDALATRNEPKLQQLTADAAEQYKIANDILTELTEQVEGDQISKINPKQFGTSWVAILRLERLAHELEDAGETAGVDFGVRAQVLRTNWGKVKQKYYAVTELRAKISAIYLKLMADSQRRSRSLLAARKLIDQQQWEQASQIVTKDIDEMEDLGCWLTDAKRQPLIPFEEAQYDIVVNLRKQRRATAIEQLTNLREQTTPDFAQLLTQLQQGAKDLRAGKNPSFDGQECTGPELLQKAGTVWQQLHLQTLQCLGIDWARGMRASEPDSQPLLDLLKAQKEFASSVVPTMAEIIVADSTRNHTSSDAAATYAAYVKVLAPLISLTGKETESEAVQSALESFAASDPALAADVKAYAAVTGDLLRWKKKVAIAQQKNLAAQYPDFEPTFRTKLGIQQKKDGATVITSPEWALTNVKKMNEFADLLPVPSGLERIKTALIGNQVTLPAATGLNPAKKLVASNYHHRHYTTFTLPPGYDEQVSALKADLLSSDSLPPLTLKAAMAIAAAERGDLQAAGVTITRVNVESLSTRMVTLPAVARPLVPLGTVPAERMTEPSLSQILLRSDVQPGWVRNQYFFVQAKQK